MRMPVRVCMCVRVSEAEVSWLFHQTLVSTPVWECAGIRSCDNRRVLLCNAVQGASGYAQSPQGRRRLAKPVSNLHGMQGDSDVREMAFSIAAIENALPSFRWDWEAALRCGF